MNTTTLPELDRVAECEAQLAALWRKNLGVPVASNDDYFTVGGDSLRGTQLLSWIHDMFGAELSLLELFESRTLAAQTQLLLDRLDRGTVPAKPSTHYRYFGDGPIFRALHRAVGDATTGVVLCYPMGQEYMRIHRTYAELARSIATSGRHALRFDYYGCGDSNGDDAGGSFSRWRDDIRAAIDELRASTGVRRVFLVGSRIGANLALDVAPGLQLAGLVLWEPIIHGTPYLATLQRAHGDLLRNNARVDGYAQRASNCPVEYLGYPMPEALLDEVRSIDLLAARPGTGLPDTFVVANSGKRELDEFIALRSNGPACFEAKVVSEPDGIWLKEDRQNKGVIPAEAVQAIVSWIARRDA